MYWSERWDDPKRLGNGYGSLCRAVGIASPPASPEKDETAPALAPPKGKPVEVRFPTAAHASRFKSCLARVPVDCRIERSGRRPVISLRPKSVPVFAETLRTNGLAACAEAALVIEWLKQNPTDYIRFEN